MPEAIETAIPSQELSPAGAWRRTIDFGLAESVDAVLLAGDVVDREDDFFEAYGLLEQGVRRLADAGIPVVGVTGNHDVQVLPRLARAIPGFYLLGEGGTWGGCEIRSRAELPAAGAKPIDVVHVVGWSFPVARVSTSPLLDGSFASTVEAALRMPANGGHYGGATAAPIKGPGGSPIVGLLHCDRDRGRSEHAPVASRDLEAAAVDAWLLGHIHVPDRLDGDRPIGYLGSLVGSDPTETGPHGPWLVEVEHRGKVRARQVPLAPLRWEHLSVACDDIATVPLGETDIAEWVDAAVLRALHDASERLTIGTYGDHKPAVLGCRITIVGRTGRAEELLAYLQRANPGALWYDCGGVSCFVDRVEVRTQPIVPIEVLARGRDPVGLLAAKLLVLGRSADDPERQTLIDAARRVVLEAHTNAYYRVLSDTSSGGAASADEDRIVRLLQQSAHRALESLLAQRSNPVATSTADS